MVEIIIFIVLFAVFGLQYAIGRMGLPSILAAILPLLWLGAVVFIGINGQLNSFRDYLMAAIGFIVLLVLFGSGKEAREKKIARESAKIDNSRGSL